MDSHTFRHIHPKSIQNASVLIGIRSFEPEEEKLLQRLGIRIYNMAAIEKRGLDTIFAEAIACVKENRLRFDVSLDLDGIDPYDAPVSLSQKPTEFQRRICVVYSPNLVKKHRLLELKWLNTTLIMIRMIKRND